MRATNTRSQQRPDPDELLRQIEAKEGVSRRGRLKIFFGCCPGVGKTYAMLLAAHERLREGVDVVIGIVETHQRPETKKLLDGLPAIEPLTLSHRGIELKEFDLDAAKARKPAVLLVDELAHTNAPNLRHPKRWNDVEELLDAGIDIYTTLNVQHIESLSDLVAGTTGIWVKESVPDSVFDNADDIILVDINVDELLKRLQEGRVYIAPEVRARALENFFKPRNLAALREIALRRTAERVDAQMYELGQRQRSDETFPLAEKILVCIGPDALSPQLIRAAKRMAVSLKAPWTAAYVENLRHYRLDKEDRQTLQNMARMAERMGGKAVTIQGDNVVEEIIAYARSNRFTKIIVGKPIRPQWKVVVFGALADKIIRKSDYIDVYVITGDVAPRKNLKRGDDLVVFRPTLYILSVLTAAVLTGIGVLLGDLIMPIDQALIYLMGVVFVAAKLGRGPSFVYSILSVTSFNYFFIPPLYSLNVYDRSYWLTFFVMLMTSLVITNQASRLRLQSLFSRKRERNTQTFYALTKELASTRSREDIVKAALKHIADTLDIRISIWTPDVTGQLQPILGELPQEGFAKETTVLQWCFANGQLAGRRTMTMPSAIGLYVPMMAASGTLGVMGVIANDAEREFSLDEQSTLETYASLLGSALERIDIAEIAEQSKVDAEREKLRTMLLSSVSHDLRTPLASITGASSAIMDDMDRLSRESILGLAQSIHKEGQRLSHIVTNLLEVTRLESGTVQLNMQPYFIEELIGAALSGLEAALVDYKVVTTREEGLPLVMVDGVLIEQVLINLLENAIHYTPKGTTITIRANRKGEMVLVSVSDNGPGIVKGNERKIFDKFYSIGQEDAPKGTGLGLAICASILHAHQGEIWAETSPPIGAHFCFTLPIAPLGKEVENASSG